MKKCIFFLFFLALIDTKAISSLKITRAIVSSDTNPMYLDFWPIVAKMWKDHIGIQPTLALIAPEETIVDTSIGDVIRFEPIPGISTALQAQVIRLLLPAYFEDDVCITSDIDMIPLNKDFFLNTVQDVPDDTFVNYDFWYGETYQMCYNIGKGTLFKEIFNINSVEDIETIIKSWAAENIGWITDEVILTRSLRAWHRFSTNFLRIYCPKGKRVDRSDWHNPKKRSGKSHYIDSHMLRPYSKYKKQIDKLIKFYLT